MASSKGGAGRASALARMHAAEAGTLISAFDHIDPIHYASFLTYSPTSQTVFVVTRSDSRCVVRINLSTGAVSAMAGTAGAVALCIESNERSLLATFPSCVAAIIIDTEQVILLAGSRDASGFADGVGPVAAFHEAFGITVDRRSSVAFVADQHNQAIRHLELHGQREQTAVVSTLAGSGVQACEDGIGGAACFNYPKSLALSLDETLLFVGEETAVRAVQVATRAVRTLAGQAERGFANAWGRAAKFSMVAGLAVAPSGQILCTDYTNNRIRAISPEGQVTTLAGTGKAGSKDGIWAKASFNKPWGIAMDPDGGLLVADNCNHSIRFLAGADTALPRRFSIHDTRAQPASLRAVIRTLTILWDGRSRRLSALTVSGIRRASYLHQHRFVYLLQWVQGALWAAAVTPAFESLPQLTEADYGCDSGRDESDYCDSSGYA